MNSKTICSVFGTISGNKKTKKFASSLGFTMKDSWMITPKLLKIKTAKQM
jgi:hypothetical protein